MQLTEIKNNLDSSDAKFIAKSTGYSDRMVRMVLNGERNNELIVKAALIVAEGKKSLVDQISIMCGEEEAA